MNRIDFIRRDIDASFKTVENVLKLLEDGATVPFISRYRKEMTNSLDEVAISNIANLTSKYDDLIARKSFILEKLKENNKLTNQLQSRIQACYDKLELEDMYAPYKSSIKTKADKARDLGLEPLAKMIMTPHADFYSRMNQFTKNGLSTESAIQGAKDIIAEWVSLNDRTREYVKKQLMHGTIVSKVVSTKKEQAEKFKDYFAFEESIRKCPSHRLLAILRGASEGLLRVKLSVDSEAIINNIFSRMLRGHSTDSKEVIFDSVKDAYKRLLYPSLSTQVTNFYKQKADDTAIETFASNLRQLLLQAPLGESRILAIDPGFRTGCKVACLDEQGEYLHSTTIYQNPPQNEYEKAKATIVELVKKYDIRNIAIGNGTASRETESFVKSLNLEGISHFVVNESGASIYSASEIARKEFPKLDVTVRGAISIGRRLMDPLAELIKIDAKSIGVGQYQYDVNQQHLKQKLDNVVIECVNKIGVNLNTASPYLLKYISGLGETLAQNVVEYRSEIGSYSNIQQLKNVKRLGNKAFEQCAGFLRIKNGDNLLDNTGVHPESYAIVQKMAKEKRVGLKEMIGTDGLIKKVDLHQYKTQEVGMPTLLDIARELEKPGVDIRGKAENIRFAESLKTIDDVKIGAYIPGVVMNIANFGAFINIGIKENALLHISKITNKYISNPSEVLSINQQLEVKVVDVDTQRKRISVSLVD